MERVKQGLLRFVEKLRPKDRVAIVGYSSEAAVLWPSTPVGDKRRVKEVIRSLTPQGYTNLHGGLMCGYNEVAKHREEDASHRVILLTDGYIANAAEPYTLMKVNTGIDSAANSSVRCSIVS